MAQLFKYPEEIKTLRSGSTLVATFPAQLGLKLDLFDQRVWLPAKLITTKIQQKNYSGRIAGCHKDLLPLMLNESFRSLRFFRSSFFAVSHFHSNFVSFKPVCHQTLQSCSSLPII